MAGEYAFVVKDLRKVMPPKREILHGIWLSFLRGAQIGVLGPKAESAAFGGAMLITASVPTLAAC
jgi:hypothetical protein